MGSILESLALSDDIADALAESSDTALGILIATIRLYEAGEWYRTENEAQKIGLNYKQLASYYQKAILWADAYDRI